MAKFYLHKVYYNPGQEVVSIAIEAADGPFKGQVRDIYTTQKALEQRLKKDATVWGDEEVMAEASEMLAVMDAELVERPAPVVTPVVSAPIVESAPTLAEGAES